MRARISAFIAIVQSILLLVYLALYGTLLFFFGPLRPSGRIELGIALVILSVSFVAASLLAHLYVNWLVRAVYALSAVWLGFITFFFLAACACWAVYLPPAVFGIHLERRPLAALIFGLAVLAGAYSIVHASRTRIKRVTVRLPDLPPAWKGRTAALVSDLHIGYVRNLRFLRRIVGMLAKLRPDILFIPGDLFDGMEIDAARLAGAWAGFSAPLGAYFVTGNHEQFSSPGRYLDAVRQFGIRVLENEKIVLD
ncbi:MAG: metallophosphoesterase, partial [Candidatus Acidiferrales bacterium]